MVETANLDPVEAYRQGIARQHAAQASMLVTASRITPDAAAEGVNLGAELGVPANVVAMAPGVFRSQAARLQATSALQSAPLTAEWVRDQTNAALAQDDLHGLTWFERNLGPLARGVGRGVRSLPAVPSQMVAGEAARQLGDIGKSLDDLIAEEITRAGGPNATPQARVLALQTAQMRFRTIENADPAAIMAQGSDALANARAILDRSQQVPMSDMATTFRDQTLANADNTVMGVLKAFLTDPVRGIAFITETAAESLPVLAASTAVTAVTRSPAAGITTMGGLGFLQENSQSAMAFLAEKGVDVSSPEGAMEVLNNAELMAEAQQRGLTRGLIISLFDMASGGVAGKTLVQSRVGEVFVQSIAQAVFGSSGEAAAQYASGQDINFADIVVEGLAELVTAPIEVGGVVGRFFLRDTSRAAAAGETATALQEIDAAVAGAKLPTRAPAAFTAFLEKIGAGDRLLYVPADDLRTFFQAKDLGFEEGLASYGIDPDTFTELEASGGDVPIPASVYASKISGTEDAAWFHDNATFSADEMSVSEAQRFNEEVRAAMDRALQEADQARQFEMETRASDVQVYDTVYTQLREAGRTVDVAQNEARVWQAFWRTMGERYGEDPLDLARSMGVDIRGPENAPVPRRRGQLDIALNTLRSQGKKVLQPQGSSLLEFVRSQGGIRDVGGDLQSIDVPKGIIAETFAQAQERRAQPSMLGLPSEGAGIGMDEMGRRAIEAGYFPDLMGGADIQADGTEVDTAAIILDAIQREVSGERFYPVGQGPDEGMMALADELSRRGIDLSTMSNDEIAAALESEGMAQDPFTVEGWQDVVVQVEMDDGTTEDMKAGEVEAMLASRIADAQTLLRCLNG